MSDTESVNGEEAEISDGDEQIVQLSDDEDLASSIEKLEIQEGEEGIELLLSEDVNFRATVSSFKIFASTLCLFFSPDQVLFFPETSKPKEIKKGKGKTRPKAKCNLSAREDLLVEHLSYSYKLSTPHLFVSISLEEFYNNTRSFPKNDQILIRISKSDPSLLNFIPGSSTNFSMTGVIQIRAKMIELDSIEIPSIDDYPEHTMTHTCAQQDLDRVFKSITGVTKDSLNATLEVYPSGFLIRATAGSVVQSFQLGKFDLREDALTSISLSKEILDAWKKIQIKKGVCVFSYYDVEDKPFKITMKRSVGNSGIITWFL